MDFKSVLYEETVNGVIDEAKEPEFFNDLNLDQIVDAITAGKQEYDLKPFYYTSLKDIRTIRYRHEIMRELEDTAIFGYIEEFARKMHNMRDNLSLSEKLYYVYQKKRYFLDAVNIYCNAVISLTNDLNGADLSSRGLSAFRGYIADYIQSKAFTQLLSETEKLTNDLSGIRYCILIKDNVVKVRKYESEADYADLVEKTFAKFEQGAGKDYTAKFANYADMNHVEANILDCVAKLYPDIFADLDAFNEKNRSFMDKKIETFDREIQFYVSYLEFIEKFKKVGLNFCYPTLSDKSKDVYACDCFDLALANYKLTYNYNNVTIVCNDFYLKDKERVFIVSGPNQGGKTTFARTFGQVHYLAGLGCPVPGKTANLFLVDRIFTHFEKEEDISNLRGKLQDDLVRIHDILNRATADSLIIINEIFSSTALKDAVLLSKRILDKIIRADMLCICVTFIDELALMSEKCVSLSSMVDPINPALRTYKIVRKPADGMLYAKTIAEKYDLTYQRIKERIKS